MLTSSPTATAVLRSDEDRTPNSADNGRRRGHRQPAGSPGPAEESGRTPPQVSSAFLKGDCELFIREVREVPWGSVSAIMGRFLQNNPRPGDVQECTALLRRLSRQGIQQIVNRFPQGPLYFESASTLDGINSYFMAEAAERGTVLPPSVMQWIALAFLAAGTRLGQSHATPAPAAGTQLPSPPTPQQQNPRQAEQLAKAQEETTRLTEKLQDVEAEHRRLLTRLQDAEAENRQLIRREAQMQALLDNFMAAAATAEQRLPNEYNKRARQ